MNENSKITTITNLINFTEESQVYEVEKLELFFSHYLSVPRAERVNIYYNMLNTNVNLADFEAKYSSYLIGYNIILKNNVELKGNENIKVTYNTDVCFFYSEYRIAFLLDISQSLFIYDFTSQFINIEKIEIFLKAIIQEFLIFNKTIKTFTNGEIIYKPKLILSFVTMGTDEDCGILSHEIYLDKLNFEEYFDILMRKLKRAIMDLKKEKDSLKSNDKLLQHKMITSCLNKMLDQSLYILDLLPRSATPILIILSDSNLGLSQIGNYNNILMQFNRVDINIHVIDLYSSKSELNQFHFGHINNESIMEYICEFTGGAYLNEQMLNQMFHNKLIDRNLTKNILNLNNNEIQTNSSKSKIISGHYLKCKGCMKNIGLFFCKKPYLEKGFNSFVFVNNNILEQVKKSVNEIGFNFSHLENFKILNNVKIYQKETFEQYKLMTPIQRITECRIRESFKMMKTNFKVNQKNKIKFTITIVPEVFICYIVKSNTKKEEFLDKHRDISEKFIRIKIKAPFYIFNHLKLEYIKNRNQIEKNQKVNLNQNKNFTNIEKILKFVKEIICTDKILSTFCQTFTLDKEFQNKENGERENFLTNNKNLWELLSNLSIHTWHRFFNVETLELMVNNKNKNFEEEMKNFFEENKSKNNFFNSKSVCEKILFNFCDKTKPDQNFGIKLLHKSINNHNKKFMNGFCIVRIEWMYENVAVVYLSFFQTFINRRRKLVQELTNEFQNYSGDFQIICSNRHLVFLVPPMQNENSEILNKNNSENNSASIFTYRPSKKLIDSYIFKKNFKYSHQNKFIMEKFIYFLIQQRTKENFTFLNSNTKGIILVTKISVSKIKNVDEVEQNDIIFKRCLMLYIMQLSPNKDELFIEILVEPVSGYYMFQFSEKEAKIFDEKNLNNALINYYKTIDKEIFESVKNFNSLMRETILGKLNREMISDDYVENSFNNINTNYTKKNSNLKLFNLFNYKNPKKDYLYNTYFCFANEEMKKNHSKLIEQIENFKKDLKDFGENILDENVKIKNMTEGMKKSLELIKEIEYKILDKKITEKEFTYLEKMIVDRFFTFFFELFNCFMDSKFEDEEKCSFYTKVISKSTLLVLRFPSIDRLLNCCKNQSGQSHCIVIHLKFYFLSIDKLKQNERKFSEILSERSSLKTVQLNQNYINNNLDENQTNSKMNFWDDNCENKIKENFEYSKNEFFDMYPTNIINNLINMIENFYKIIYNKNNLITYIENNEGRIENLLKDSCQYNVNFDLTNIFLIESPVNFDYIFMKFFEILTSHFKYLNHNFYSNEKITNNFDSESEVSLLDENNCNEKNLRNIKDLFMMEVNLIENINNENKNYPLVIHDKDKLKEIIRQIYFKVNYNQQVQLSLNFKIFFVPEIEDIFSEVNLEEIREQNIHLSSVNHDNYSIYYYQYNDENNSNILLKNIPAYIEYHNQEDYYVMISKKQKKYIENITQHLISLERIIKSENIRNNLNSSQNLNNLDYIQIYEIISNLQNNFYESTKMKIQVISKQELLKYFEIEPILIKIKKKGNRVYIFDFENNYDSNLNNYISNFKKFCLENLEKKDYNNYNYKIPIWLLFQYCQTEKSLRKFSIDDLKDDQICFEVKWICIEENLILKEELKDKIFELIQNLVKMINRKILMNILKEKNICDERLFPLSENISNKNDLKNDYEEEVNNSPLININSIFKLKKNFWIKSKTGESLSGRESLHSSFISKLGNTLNAMNQINPFNNMKFSNQNIIPNLFLESHFQCRYYNDYDIEEVYKLMIEDAKEKYKINNREDIFKIIYEDEIFILKIILTNEDGNSKNDKKSFTDNSILNMSQVTNLNKFKNGLQLEEDPIQKQMISKTHNVTINLFGLCLPSADVMKIVKDFANEKISIVKLKYYVNLLKKLNQEEFKNLENNQKLLESQNKINEAIKNLNEKSNVSWNKLFCRQDEVNKLDLELIYNFSDKISLEKVFPQFVPITELNKNYFDNLHEYFRIFKENKIVLFRYNEDTKIIIIPEIVNYAFLIKVKIIFFKFIFRLKKLIIQII